MRISRMNLFLALAMTHFLSFAASAATLEVPAQYPSIAAALAVANRGDVVRISSGTYQESDLVLTTDVTLVGAGESPADCVIDAQGQGRVLTAQFVGGLTVIRNLTLANGHAAGETSYDSSGGGLFINSSAVSLESCRLVSNSAEYSGGGMRCMGADVTIAGCVFENNTALDGGGALDLSYGSSGQITDTNFTDNQADYGGALACRGDSNPTLTDCSFAGNTAAGELGEGGGALVFFFSYPEFVRCVFRDNSAKKGGAIYNATDSRADFSYCTVMQNTASERGGGIFSDNASPSIETTLIVFQEGEGILSLGDSIPQILCSDIYGNSRGDWVGNIADQNGTRGNLSVDPLFCSEDPDLPPVLQTGSPCTLEGGSCDDMGALGSGCYSAVGDDDSPQTPPLTLALENLGAWPNPFNPRTQVHFELGAGQRVRVDVYGIDGRKVRSLANEDFAAGSWDLVWNGVDDGGRAVASGTYVVLVAGEKTTSRLKVTLLK